MASRLTELYYKPSVVLTLINGLASGSSHLVARLENGVGLVGDLLVKLLAVFVVLVYILGLLAGFGNCGVSTPTPTWACAA